MGKCPVWYTVGTQGTLLKFSSDVWVPGLLLVIKRGHDPGEKWRLFFNSIGSFWQRICSCRILAGHAAWRGRGRERGDSGRRQR